MDNLEMKHRNKRDKEVAKILENTVLNHIDGKKSPVPYKMLKGLIEILRKDLAN